MKTIELTAEAADRTSDPQVITYQSRHLRPLSPVHAKVVIDDEGLHLTWIRRARIGGDRWAGLDVPLGEEREFYRVEFLDGDEVLEAFEVNENRLSIATLDMSIIENSNKVMITQGASEFGFGPFISTELEI